MKLTRAQVDEANRAFGALRGHLETTKCGIEPRGVPMVIELIEILLGHASETCEPAEVRR